MAKIVDTAGIDVILGDSASVMWDMTTPITLDQVIYHVHRLLGDERA
jgi:ketopantoate hydroxymethyltransferase